MRIKRQSPVIFDGTTLIEIPFFQRSYVWDKYLWERFLNDMEFTVKQSPHIFLVP